MLKQLNGFKKLYLFFLVFFVIEVILVFWVYHLPLYLVVSGLISYF